MSNVNDLRERLIFMRRMAVLLMLFLSAISPGQVRPMVGSIEADVAAADSICVGKVSKIQDVWVNGFSAIELTIRVSRTLKGPRKENIVTQRFGSFGYDTREYYERACTASVEFVWFTFPGMPARTEYSLDPNSSPFAMIGALAVGMDFTLLKTRKEVLDRVHQFQQSNPKSKGREALLTPLPSQPLNSSVDFVVPLGPWAEKLAIRMITHPESFNVAPPIGNPTKAEASQQWGRTKTGMLRTEGLILLRHYRSEANIELVKHYLTDDSMAIMAKYSEPNMGFYWVRATAYRLLSHWGVAVERPVEHAPAPKDVDGYGKVDLSRINRIGRP